MDCSMPGFPVLHYLPEFTQIHVHWVNDTIQLPHRLPLPPPPAFNLSQNQGLFQWTGSSHQMTKYWGLALNSSLRCQKIWRNYFQDCIHLTPFSVCKKLRSNFFFFFLLLPNYDHWEWNLPFVTVSGSGLTMLSLWILTVLESKY